MAYTSKVRFSWDPVKDRENRKKHGISFDEAAALFTSGADYLEIFDHAHSDSEDRFIAIGPLEDGLILIVWTERDEETIRIISARWASRREQSLYRSYLERTP